MAETIDKLLTVEQVAGELLNCSVAFVYARLADGSLKHYRLGNGQGGIRISREHLQEYLRSREKGGASVPAPIKERSPPVKHLA